MSKIFVIDDSISACVAIERMLGSHEFDVVWETDAVTALSTVEKHAPDLVICDVVLPEIDGFEICRSLRTNPLLNKVPVVMISGLINDDLHQRARDVDAAVVMAKPFTPEQLIETVQATLDSIEPIQFDEPETTLSTAIRRQIASELETLQVAGRQSIFVTDDDGQIVASTGSPEPDSLPPALLQELTTLSSLAAAARELHDSATARLTLETKDGVRTVERLEGGYSLVVTLPSARSFGKARFLVQRLRSRLESILRTD